MSKDALFFFEPKEDITAYELAVVVAHISGMTPPKNGVYVNEASESWISVPESVKRHFRRKNVKA